jgi:hypothetical protein
LRVTEVAADVPAEGEGPLAAEGYLERAWQALEPLRLANERAVLRRLSVSHSSR